jgi:hypothetical protein
MFDPDYAQIWEEERALRELYALPGDDPRRPDRQDPFHGLIELSGSIPIPKMRIQRVISTDKPQDASHSAGYFNPWVLPPELRKRLVIAGGYPLSLIRNTRASDVDFFIIHPDYVETTRMFVEYINDLTVMGAIFNRLTRHSRRFSRESFTRTFPENAEWSWPPTQKQISKMRKELIAEDLMPTWIKTRYALTAIQVPNPSDNWHVTTVQLVLRSYVSPSEVITGFDIDACCVLLYGEKLYTTPRGYRALSTSANVVNVELASTTYHQRLVKYYHRGFGIQLPVGTPAAAFKLHELKHYQQVQSDGKIWRYQRFHQILPAANIGSLIYACCRNYIPKRFYSDYDRKNDKNRTIPANIANRRLFLNYQQVTQVVNQSHPEITLEYLVLNPGQQNHSWSVNPLRWIWENWLVPEAVQKPPISRTPGGTDIKAVILRNFEPPIQFNWQKPNFSRVPRFSSEDYMRLYLFGRGNYAISKDVLKKRSRRKTKKTSQINSSEPIQIFRRFDNELVPIPIPDYRFESGIFINWNDEVTEFTSEYPCPDPQCICTNNFCHAKCTAQQCKTCDLRALPELLHKMSDHFASSLMIKFRFDIDE